MVVCDGQCACTLCDWLNVTLNSHIAVACSKQWPLSHTINQNKSVLKQTCERRASVFGDSTSEREFTLLCCFCKYTLCYFTKHCSVSNWFTWLLCVHAWRQYCSKWLVTTAQLRIWSQHVGQYRCKITRSIRFLFDNFLQPSFCAHQNPTHVRTQTRQQRVVLPREQCV